MTTTLKTPPVIAGPLSELDVRRFLKSGALPKHVEASKVIVRNTALCLIWFAVMIAAATWMRFEQFPWEML